MATILVIDDDPSVLRLMRRILEAEGHEVHEAEDGKTALRRFVGLAPDLVVTDVFMPEMNGIELLMRLREAFPDARIVTVSGGGSIPRDRVLAGSVNLGAVASLAKPFTREGLVEVVKAALREDAPSAV